MIGGRDSRGQNPKFPLQGEGDSLRMNSVLLSFRYPGPNVLFFQRATFWKFSFYKYLRSVG